MTSEDSNSSSNKQFKAGDLIKLQNLSAPNLNDRFGIVGSFVAETGRYEIKSICGHGTRRLAVKPENLSQEAIWKPMDPEFSTARQFQHVVFWPRPKNSKVLPVHAFEDWPRNQNNWEEDFLMERLHWKDPQVVGGVESRGVAKPDFMLYFDKGNVDAPINQTAQTILANLPDYELQKILGVDDSSREAIKPRGTCVLIYSPMKMTTYSSFGGPNAPPPASNTSGNADRLFSLQQLRETLIFQESPEGKQQYEEHDDPMHRMFGGMF